MTSVDPLLDPAIRLFTFLRQSQQLRAPRVHDVAAYTAEGAVHWLADLPDHPAVRVGPEHGDLVVAMDRVPRIDPPEPGEELSAWLAGPVDDAEREPGLLAERAATVVDELADDYDPDENDELDEHEEAPEQLRLVDHPEVVDLHERYLLLWRAWAEQEHSDEPVRRFYGELFSAYLAIGSRPEDLELVIGNGLLAWLPPAHPTVRRHLLTTAAAITLDDGSGRLTVTVADASDPTRVELEMLDPALLGDPAIANAVRREVRDGDLHPLDRAGASEFIRRLVLPLSADAACSDVDIAPTPAAHPVAAFAPAIVLRKRTQQGLIEIFQTITEQMRTSGHVPSGIRPLLDPDSVPQVASGLERSDGARVRVDDDLFLPLLVNDKQLLVLDRVDHNAQTVIQGPPGTGKTHTAAVLLSHLLARGKRVLVTAHTDRALKEVRGKLPAPIQPLAVSVVGTSREDLSDLRVAVERIAATAAEHEPHQATLAIDRLLATIETLRERRATIRSELLDVRVREVHRHKIAGYQGTLAGIARDRDGERDAHRWIDDCVDTPAGPPPLDNTAAVEWLGMLRDSALTADEQEAAQPSIPIEQVPDPAQLAALLNAESAANRRSVEFDQLRRHRAYPSVRALDDVTRIALTDRLRTLYDQLELLGRRPGTWTGAALRDVLTDHTASWSDRAALLTGLQQRCSDVLEQLDPVVTVTVDGDLAGLDQAASALREHLRTGQVVKIGRDGMPRLGRLAASRSVRQAEPLFARVRVNDSPPTTTEQLDAFLAWREAGRLLDALDRAWPTGTAAPSGLRPRDRLAWHRAELTFLDRLLLLSSNLRSEESRYDSSRVPRPRWEDPNDVRAVLGLSDAARAAEAAERALRPVDDLTDRLATRRRLPEAGAVVGALLDAVRTGDLMAYSDAYRRLLRLHTVSAQARARDETTRLLDREIPRLSAAVAADPSDPVWDGRLARLEQAWNWAAAGAWIAHRPTTDVNALQSQIACIEDEIRNGVQELAAVRAWTHAVGRLTQSSKANLEQYASLVRKFGKTGGAQRGQRLADIRDAMDRSRPAVPVWIMPLYRIADQLRVEPDMFDVVIVDEASQAGLEASFLQYLAPRIVVIGDDKQVSPSAVGVDQQQLTDLSRQYLNDHRYHATWKDPTYSLFDVAKMYFSGLVTLTEHRRCVPEIIEFSNRIAYEPAGVRLVPVRQVGSERLPPVCPVLVDDGYETGGTSRRVNRAEAEAIVAQIEKCVADPRYDDLTFGVISLLGTAQAKAVEQMLQDLLPPDEWSSRDLRCGDAADFQGSERDVVFLSMVAAPTEDRRLNALTTEQFVQRYNVAVSRAKEQVWVFHSVRLDQLSNTEDMRFQLLDYCYGVARQAIDADETTLTERVGDDVLVPPFSTLFAQRVANRLLDGGYTVVPRHEELGYPIDLVVTGASSRLALSCVGDRWDGPDVHQRDLARQRDLERCGWSFVHVLESEFQLDPLRALAPVLDRLGKMGIQPTGWSEPEPPVVRSGADETSEVARVASSTTAYRPFEGSVRPLESASRADLIAGIVDVVAAEGPIVGRRAEQEGSGAG